METLTAIDALRACIASARRHGKRVAYVPTMGNLHAGHLQLVAHARARADVLVASVFVNPLQFGPDEDFDAYPRTLDADRRQLEAAGVEVLFAPTAREMYPLPMAEHTRVYVPGLSDTLCGASRPGHFEGVATVVAKLLGVVKPEVAVFGQKDYQQLLVIRRLVSDLCLDVRIDAAPTARHADGLALSSRNGYLHAAERERAPELYRTLCALRDRLHQGERHYAALEAEGGAMLERAGFVPDYLQIRRAADLAPPEADSDALMVLAAAYLGGTRLIDNVTVDAPEDGTTAPRGASEQATPHDANDERTRRAGGRRA